MHVRGVKVVDERRLSYRSIRVSCRCHASNVLLPVRTLLIRTLGRRATKETDRVDPREVPLLVTSLALPPLFPVQVFVPTYIVSTTWIRFDYHIIEHRLPIHLLFPTRIVLQ